jgi:hypothetical protein
MGQLMDRIVQCKLKTLDQHDQQGILHLKRQRHDKLFFRDAIINRNTKGL